MLRPLFYVILVVSCIVGIQADESKKDRSVQELVDDAILKSMTRRSNRVEDKLRLMDNDKHASEYWDIYKNYYNHTYSTPEENEKRQKNFIESLKLITKTNDPLRRTVSSFKLGLNKFSGMDFEEFKEHYTGVVVPDESETSENAKHFSDGHNLTSTRRTIVPKTLDYRQYMNPIEDQGRCGSCYAFATLAAIEGTHALKKKSRFNLSKQQIVDCLGPPKCKGVYIHKTLDYVKQRHGVQLTEFYPYRAVKNTCSMKSKPVGAIINYGKVKPHNEYEMKLALNKYGPLIAVINVTPEFKALLSGIITISSCSKIGNHAVVIVGYGTESGRDYWLVRNSWGTTWGEKGYFKIPRNEKNNCGISTLVYYITV